MIGARAAFQATHGLGAIVRAILGRFSETNLRIMMQAKAIKVTPT
ncbi:MAG: hypothetical protein ACI9BK_002701 [Acidimicrobiales bacterium]